MAFESGSMYNKIIVHFDVHESTVQEIKHIMSDRVHGVPEMEVEVIGSILPDTPQSKDAWYLAKSGGVDSSLLATICPELTPTTAYFPDLDDRERLEQGICRSFNSCEILSTARHHVGRQTLTGTLMLAVLPHDDCKYIVTGKVYTDSNIRVVEMRNPEFAYHPVSELTRGVTKIDALVGMSNVGSYNALHRLNPDVYETLVQHPASLNRYLCDAATIGKFRDIDVSHLPKWKWVSQRLMMCYFVKLFGATALEPFVEGIPAHIEDAIKDIDFGFMTKYDQMALDIQPADFREYFAAKLVEADIETYTEQDYQNRAVVLSLIYPHNLQR